MDWRSIAAGDGIVAVITSGGQLSGWRLDDGTPAWDLPQAEAIEGGLATAGDLLIHRTGEALVGRSLTSGAEVWRKPELDRVEVFQGHRVGDTVLVLGRLVGTSDSDGLGRGSLVAGVDAATGELRWHVEGRDVTIAADDLAIVLTDDGMLEAYEPSGERRWEVEGSSDPEASTYAMGSIVRVLDGDEGPLLRHVADGRPLDARGWPVATDGEATLVLEADLSEDGTSVTERGMTLFDGAGEVWRVDGSPEGSPGDACYRSGEITADAIVLIDCRGATYTLGRADGSTVSRVEPRPWLEALPPDELAIQFLGPYALHHTRDGAVVLRDAEDGSQVADLPPDTWPVGEDHGPWRDRHDGVVVLHSPGWLAAIALDGPSRPGDRAAPDAEDPLATRSTRDAVTDQG